MTWLWFLLCVLSLTLLWVSWRHWLLRRRLDAFTQQLYTAKQGTLPLEALTTDVKGLEHLSSAVHALLMSFQRTVTTLQAEHRRLAHIVEQLTDGVLIADAEGIARFVNPAAKRIFGATEALLGRSVPQILRHHRLIEVWKSACASREVQMEAVEWSQRRLFLQLIVVPEPQDDGGSLLLVQDLTHVRHLETMRRDFISNFSHELRTPLAALKALAETLQEVAPEDVETFRHFLQRIQQEVEVLNRMASDLLELARLDAGKETLAMRTFSPFELIARVGERMRLHAERAGLHFRLECPDNLPSVCADDAKLERALVNLVHNAVKFTPAGGEVTLRAERGGGGVRFVVQDTGVGIPAEELPRIFERFYRVDRAHHGEGSGLGLSIARHLIEAHGSKLKVESIEGHGSTFSFIIPLAQGSIGQPHQV